eukprot:790004-Pyramimonas_sp.AAC.6
MTLSPNSSPHTPHSEHNPEWAQSGTVCPSKAFCRSVASQLLEMPVSMWSQGSGAESRASANWPRSNRPFPPAPCLRKFSSPRASSTSHSPFLTWPFYPRYRTGFLPCI